MGKEGEEFLREKSVMNGFDENIVIEILVRLPMKNQFQCKLVCKRWFNLVSSPLFAQRVLATKVSSSMPWFFIYRYDQPYFICGPPEDFDEFWEMYDFHTASDHNSDEPIIPQLTINLRSEYTGYTVYAAHNGLILCHTYRNYGRGEGLFVCNPLTGKWVSIPDSPMNRFGIVGFIVSLNNGRTQFKVVRATCEYHHYNYDEYTCEYSNFEVFSSEVGEWRDTGVSFPLQDELYNDTDDPNGVVCDGKLVWRFGVTADRLVAFDPDKKECRIFSLNVPSSESFETIMGTCCGRLCYANYATDNEEKMSLSVYVLENYEKEEWREISSNVDMNEIDDEFRIAPLAFHPFGMDIVYFKILKSHRTRIFSFNIQTSQFISFIGEEIPKYLYVKHPILVFVLPPLPTPVPELSYDYTNQDYALI